MLETLPHFKICQPVLDQEQSRHAGGTPLARITPCWRRPHPKRSNGDESSFSRHDGVRFKYPMEGSLALLEVSNGLQTDRRCFSHEPLKPAWSRPNEGKRLKLRQDWDSVSTRLYDAICSGVRKKDTLKIVKVSHVVEAISYLFQSGRTPSWQAHFDKTIHKGSRPEKD